jgi:hypothetical protein
VQSQPNVRIGGGRGNMEWNLKAKQQARGLVCDERLDNILK